MYKYSRWFLLLMGLLIFPIADAQTEAQPASASLNYTKGSTNTSLFTGRMSYSIPIYTIEDPDFHLDIALKYSTEGFKPFLSSGCYGIDWKLEAGGCITRSVQGKPDDQKNCYYTTNYNYPAAQDIGFIYALKDSNFLSKDNVFNFDNNVYDTSCGVQYRMDEWEPCIWELDYMPDIFSFDFCGYKGRFIINNAGKARIISGDFVKIDVSNITTRYKGGYCSHYYSPDSSQISITTKDGYKYIFGGEENALEYSALFKTEYNNTYHSNTILNQERPAISAWHIKQILAPNGRVMTFNYESGNDHTPLENHLRAFLTDYDWSEQSIACTDNDSTHILYFLHKECLLNSIIISGTAPLHIIFSSHLESFPKYENSSYNYSIPNLELDSITVVCDNQVLKTTKLTYQYESHSAMWGARNCNWRYLKQVVISGVGTYTMTYNVFNPYPATNLDPNMSEFIHLHRYPNLYTKTDSAYLSTVDRFGFWKVTSLQGMLSEVTLPTGGKLRFTYGNHQYAEERRFRAVGERDVELQTLLTSNQTMGGARIEKIETFSDDTTLVETKTYSYLKLGTNNSSGVFYNLYEVFLPNDLTNGHPIANPYNYGMIDSHIGYSYVEQVTCSGEESYKTAYTFDTGNKTYSSLNNSLINRRDSVPDYDSVKEICSGSLTHDGWLRQTGKLLKIEKYIGNTLAKSIQYKYNGPTQNIFGQYTFDENALGCLDTIVCLSKYSAHIARKLLVCPDVLEQVTTTEYDTNGDALVSSTANTYDSKLRIKKTTVMDGQGVKYFTKYTYPDEVPGSDQLNGYPTPLFILCHSTANRIGDPVETISGYIENNTEYITEGKIKIYGMNTYVEGNSLFFVPYLNKTMSLSLSSPITTYTYMSALNSQVTYDEHYRLDCEYFFDTMLRPLSVKPYGETETRYTWNGIYPVSKTVGNQTTTYTYIPYVGVSSMTDPRGITTYYTYDSAGRLIETYQIINDRKQIINAYQYHIKTE